MRINLEKIGKVMTVAAAVGGFVVAVGSQMMLRKTADLMDKSVKDLKDLDAVDVKEAIVNKAIEAAVEKRVQEITGRVYTEVKAETTRKANAWVDDTIKGMYDTIADDVVKQMAREIAKIDQVKLKKDVTAEAKKIIVEKFDGQLDDQLMEFNKNLENVGKIYQSIAQKMDTASGGTGKSVNLTLG